MPVSGVTARALCALKKQKAADERRFREVYRIFEVSLLHVIVITGVRGCFDYASNPIMGAGASYTEPSPGK